MTGRGGGEALACIRPGLSKEKEALTKADEAPRLRKISRFCPRRAGPWDQEDIIKACSAR